jgi:molybdate transport system ATP-binding protein
MNDQVSRGCRTSGAPLLVVRGLELRLHGRRFFAGLDWQMREGEQWAVVGPNGSGKTLLARVIMGEVPASRGEIEYRFGRTGTGARAAEPTDFPPGGAMQHVAFESQQACLAGAESYYQARWESSSSEATARLSEWLGPVGRGGNGAQARQPATARAPTSVRRRSVVSLLQLKSLWHRRLSQLSNGEMRRALLGRALLQAPELLILDDPFAGLDVCARPRLRRAIERMMRAGVRMLHLTARIEELPRGITHVLWPDGGRMLAQGPREELVKRLRASRFAGRGLAQPTRWRIVRKAGAVASAGSRRRLLLRLRNVCVAYDGHEILSGIDWEIRHGEHWALLGPNGSGKTTLLSLILGDNPQAYANDIRIQGRRLGQGLSLWELRRQLALVSPELQVHHPSHLSARETVGSGFFDTIGLHRRLSPSQRRVVAGHLRQVGLGTRADTPLGALSVGQQRLVLLGRALIKRPRLLVLDEPCQGLDSLQRRKILAAIEAIGQSGRTQIILVTHHAGEIPPCITHVLRLRRGRVAEQGRRPEQIQLYRRMTLV